MNFPRWQQLLDSLDYPLVFVDTETTSANIERAQILEVGCVIYGSEGMGKDMSLVTLHDHTRDARAPGMLALKRCRCNPGTDVLASSEFKRSQRIHRLEASTLKGYPRFSEQAELVAGWLDSGYVLGFNSEHYDMPLLDRRLTNAGYALDPVSRVSVDVWRILAHLAELAKPPEGVEDPRQYGTPYDADPIFMMSEGLAAFRQNLGTVHEALLGCPVDKTAQHGSLYDNVLAANVLAAAMELWPEHVPATILGLQHMSKVPPRNWPDWEHFLHYEEETAEWLFTRGEHRGLALQEVPSGYLQWVVGKGTFEVSTVRVLKRFLRQGDHLYPGALRAQAESGA